MDSRTLLRGVLVAGLVMAAGIWTGGAAPLVNTISEPVVLNNFVTMLVRVEEPPPGAEGTIGFRNPREGWILIRATASTGRGGSMRVALGSLEGDRAEDLIEHTTGVGQTVEAMRHLPAGSHSLRVSLRDVALESLTVRTVPVLLYATANYHPYMARFGRYDWGFLKRVGMLDSCNVMICGHPIPYSMRKWIGEGKQVVGHAGVPALRSDKGITGDEAYTYWAAQPALTDARFAGAVLDEFYAAEPCLSKFPAYRQGMLRIVEEGRFNRPYLYLGDDDPPHRVGNAVNLRPLVEPLARAGCYFAFERYLQEKSTEEEARAFMHASLRNEMLEFHRYAPDFASRCIYVMGFLSAGALNLNNNPQVDFKVHLDMQFHLLATDPALAGLHGLELYLSGYCDEEYLRWGARLFKHYGIDGRRDRLTDDPYMLAHIRNGDFAEGLQGWTVAAAEPGSVATRRVDGYGTVQGRYPRSDRGDTFLWTRRSEGRPNVVSQQIRDLTPGRFYAIRLITGDFRDPTICEPHRVCMEVTGAEHVQVEDIQGSYPSRTSRTDVPNPVAVWENRQKDEYGRVRFWFNYHRYVFRAMASTAQLNIYDWYTPTYRKGVAGGEMMLNAIEVAPYLVPDILKE